MVVSSEIVIFAKQISEIKKVAQKPSIPKGTRDFSPEEVMKRSYLMDTIKSCFVNFGFQPIETPSFENSETLMGKYGEEGDRLIFKVLESGEYFDYVRKDLKEFNYVIDSLIEVIEENKDKFYEKYDIKRMQRDRGYLNSQLEKIIEKDPYARMAFTTLLANMFKFTRNTYYEELFDITFSERKPILREALLSIIYENYNYSGFKIRNLLNTTFYDKVDSVFLSKNISRKALRYDLTVPFARYVVQYQNDITFPFKRYQIQPVWRADRPQKGRFREFYQCDADVVGSDSLWQEVELVQLYDAVFTQLGLEGVTIKMNNRKILSGLAEVIDASDKLIDFTVALDKLDKIGEAGVKQEMLEKGISSQSIEKVQPLFGFKGNASEKLNLLKDLLVTSEIGMSGIEELEFILNAIDSLSLKSANLEVDVTLARGLNYYTGAIFEVAAPAGVAMGSIGGGGRYDDLTGIFGMKDMSGVGISFGLDRIYLVLEELNLFPKQVSATTQVLFLNFGEKEALYAMKAISALRTKNISAELYPDAAKFKKQMSYADKRDIPFVVLAGDNEMDSQTFTLKDMSTGEQQTLSQSLLIDRLTSI